MTLGEIPREMLAETTLGKLAAAGCDLAPLGKHRELVDAITTVPSRAPTYVDELVSDVTSGRIKPDQIEKAIGETAAREANQERWNAHRTAISNSASARLLTEIRGHGQAFLDQMRQPFTDGAEQLSAALDGLGGVTSTDTIARDERLGTHYRRMNFAIETLSTVADGVRSLADVGFLRGDNQAWLWFVALGEDYTSAEQLPRPKPEHPLGPWAAWVAAGHALKLAADPAEQAQRAQRWREVEAGRTPVDPYANATPAAIASARRFNPNSAPVNRV